MIKLLLQLLSFLADNVQLLTSLTALVFIFLLPAKSIKRYPAVYCIIFALPASIFTVRQISAPFGITLFDFPRGSVMSNILHGYVHMSEFACHLLIIIIYIGALSVRNRNMKRLMTIREKLPIISGFPVLIHALERLKPVPRSFDYFFGNDYAAADSSTAVADSSTAVVTNSDAIINNSAEVVNNSTEVINNSAVVINSSMEVVNNSAVVINNSSEVVNNLAVVINNSAVVINNLAEVINNSAVVINNLAEVINSSMEVISN